MISAVMDFLDPEKQKAHSRRLTIGYILIALALVLATTVLLYWAFGFELRKDGQIIQNGLVFVSSRPNKADIYVNNAKYKDRTNTRLQLPAGQYAMQIKRDDYRTWKRGITVEGGVVERFDYPFLFPANLATKVTHQYTATPSVATQSLDRRWLLLGGIGAPDTFNLYDLKSKTPAPKDLVISTDILAAASTTTGWQAVEWAADNRHVLLKRSYTKNSLAASEYVLVNREEPTLSQNLTILFGITPTAMEFRGRTADQFYAYDQNSSQLFTVSIKEPTPQPFINHILAYAIDNDDILYVTDLSAPTGKVLVQIKHSEDNPYTVRRLPAGTPYVVALGNYNDDLYVAAGAENENRVYIYKDPIGQIKDEPKSVPVPEQLLRVNSPKFVDFSMNKRFVVAQNADHFATFDIENERAYAFQTKTGPEAPTTHASWIDGFHLMVPSGGKTTVFDFDGANWQNLSATSPSFSAFMNPDYHYLYNISAQNALTSTPLLLPEDL
jgi:hypothetical protein